MNKTKLTIRLLSVFMTIAMLVSSVPMTAFAKQTATIETTDDFQFQSSNALGNELSQLAEANLDEQENSDYSIWWLEVEGKVATVEFTCIDTCSLVVAVFSEQNQMLASGTTEVTADMSVADVTIDIKEMPPYFVVKAFLLDSDMGALCDEITNYHYTSAFQEFFELTVNDFDESNVINLDSSLDNNFAVVREDAYIIYPSETVNILVNANEDEGIYTFRNADKTLRKLSTGETLYYNTGDNNYILVQVLSVETQNDITTVYADLSAEIADLFDYVKIDENHKAEETTIDTTNTDAGVTLNSEKINDNTQTQSGDLELQSSLARISGEMEGSKTKEFEFGVNKTFKKDNSTLTLKGLLNVSIGAEVRCYYSVKLKWFDLDINVEFYLKVPLQIGYDIGIYAKTEYASTLVLGDVDIPIYPGIFAIGGKISLSFSMSGEISVTGSVTRTFGFTYTYGNGFKKIDDKTGSLSPDVEVSAKVRLGLELELSAVVLTVLSVGVTGGVGIEAGVVGNNPQKDFEDGDDLWHNCDFCLDGYIDFYANFGFKIEIGYKRLSKTLLDKKVLGGQFRIFDFYISVLGENKSSIGSGDCPNIYYRVDCVVKDNYGKAMEGAAITGGKTSAETDSTGKCHIYAPVGPNEIIASYEDYVSQTRTVKISNKATSASYRLEPVRLSSISIAYLPHGREYYVGDCFDPDGIILYGHYNDGTTTEITEGFYCTTEYFENPGRQTVTLIYEGKKVSFDVVVYEVEPVGLELLYLPTYYIHDDISVKTPIIELKFNNGEYLYIPFEELACSATVFEQAGKQTVTVNYDEFELSFVVDVIPISSISVKSLPKYYVGDSIEKEDLVFQINYANGHYVDIPYDYEGLALSVREFSEEGIQTVTATYDGYSVDFEVDVIPIIVESIEVIDFYRDPYYVGEQFNMDRTAFVVLAYLNNGKTTTAGGSMLTVETGSFNTAGLHTAVISYGGQSCKQDILVVQSGADIILRECGERVYCCLDKNSNSLYVYGCGVMKDYLLTSSIVSSLGASLTNKRYVQTVKVGYGVKSLGNNAFYNCDKLRTITIAPTVTSIGKNAFKGCTVFERVEFSDKNNSSLATIGESAFYGLERLTVIEIPDSVSDIGSKAFYECENLYKVSLPLNLLKLNSNLFYNCSALFDVTIPENVTLIDEYAFYNCSNISTLNIPENVEMIGKYAFNGCSSLQSINIPEKVTEIGRDAFSKCTSLKNVSFAESIKLESLGAQAFMGCTSLESISLPKYLESFGTVMANLSTVKTSKAFANCTNLKTVTFASNIYITEIPVEMFMGCTSLESVEFSSKITAINDSAFKNCTSLKGITAPSALRTIGKSAFEGCTGLESFTIDDYSRLFVVSELAFSGCKNLEEFNMPKTLTVLGKKAFSGCTSLKEVNIPSSVNSIGDYAFNGCTGIEKAVIAAYNGTALGNYAFNGCTNLEEVEIISGIASVGNYAFNNCEKLDSVIFDDDSILSIGDYAFANCASLGKISIPENVTNIGSFAFSNCTDLVNVEFLEYSSLNILGDSAFLNCIKLKEIYLPDTVTQIGQSAFSGCADLKSANIPAGVAVISDYLFANCQKLESIEIPISVIAIGNYAFNNCSDLESVTFDTNSCLRTIGDHAFAFCNSIEIVRLPVGIKSIGEYGFYSCLNFEKLYLPNTVSELGVYAFDECPKLQIIYGGTQNHWEKIFDDYEIDDPGDGSGEGSGEGSGSASGDINVSFGNEDLYLSVLTVSAENTIPGNRYILLVFESDDGNYSLDKLVYIKTEIATASTITFNYIPKYYSGIEAVIVGEFETASGDTETVINPSLPGIRVESLTLSESEITLTAKGEPFKLTANVYPEDASVKDVAWSTDNAEVANVTKYGTVIPLSPGTAIITATTCDEEFIAACKVTVVAQEYSVTWVVDDNTKINQTYSYREKIVCPEDPVTDGMQFVGWKPAVEDRMPDYDLVYYAVWKESVCLATFDANGGAWSDGSDLKEVETKFNYLIEVPENPQRDGYIFSGWTYNDNNIGTNVGKMINIDGMNFKAEWFPETDYYYTVNTYVMNTDGEYECYTQRISASLNETITLSIPAKTGFTLNADNSNLSGIVSEDSSLVLSVYFDRNIYSLNMDVDGKNNVLEYYYEEIISVEDPQKDGYTFDKWSDVLPAKMPANDIYVYACWTANAYTVTFNANGGMWDNGSDKKIIAAEYNSLIDAPVPPQKKGYIFAGWIYDGHNYGTNVGYMNYAFSVSFDAEWVKSNKAFYTIQTYTMDTNGVYSVSEEEIEDEIGKEIILTPVIDSGMTLNVEKSVLAGAVAEDDSLVLKVYVDRNEHSLTTVVDGVEETQKYYYGQSIAVKDPQKEGHIFEGWSPSIPEAMPDEDLTVTAQWQPDSYNVTWIVDGNKTVETYKYGEKIVKPENPTKNGCVFTGWTPEIPETMPAEDLTFHATWENGNYNLLVNFLDSDGEEIAESYSATHEYGSNYSVTCPDVYGYSTNNKTITGKMPGENTVIDVYYSRNEHTLSFVAFGEVIETHEFYCGDRIGLSVTPPVYDGYTFAGMDEIPDIMPDNDVEIELSYAANEYNLIIDYVYSDGSQAAPSVIETVKYGEKYRYTSPDVEGYTPNFDIVSGTMEAENFYLRVTYTVNGYSVYIKVDGKTVDVYAFEYGDKIDISGLVIPQIKGYTYTGMSDYPETMPANNVIINLCYELNKYKLDISYVYHSGGKAAEPVSKEIGYGESYSVTSPEISGCIADLTVVSGVMEDKNVTVKVIYKTVASVTYDANGASGIAPTQPDVAQGDEITVQGPGDLYKIYAENIGADARYPIDVVLVLDSSGSMTSNDRRNLRLQAAKEYCNSISDVDRVAVVDFDSEAKLLSGFTNDKTTLINAINKIDSDGLTNIGEGLLTAINLFDELEETNEQRTKIVILLTDGYGDYISTLTTEAASKDITVFTIGLGNGVKDVLLKSIADGTKGQYFWLSSANELSALFDIIRQKTVTIRYEFLGWLASNESGEIGVFEEGNKLTVESDTVFEAIWGELDKMYIVEWVVGSKNYKKVYDVNAVPVFDGSTDVPDDGYTYTFLGWDADGDGSVDYRSGDVFPPVTARTTYVAIYHTEKINVTGIRFDIDTLRLYSGETAKLTASVVPATASDKTVIWSSADSSIASVAADGTVTAVSVGSVIITATSKDGGYTAVCRVTVVDDVLEAINVEAMPVKTEYFVGDTLDTAGFTLKASYASGRTEFITSDFTCSPTKLTTAGIQTVTATYEDKTCTFDVTVKAVELVKIEVKTMPTKTEYFVGDTLDTTGLALTATNNNGATETVTSGFTCTPTILNTVGPQAITVTYGGLTTTITVNVICAHTDCEWVYAGKNVFEMICFDCTEICDTKEVYLTLSADSNEVINKGTLVLTTTVTDDFTEDIVYSSSDESVATVDENGVVTANSLGTATITATIADTDIKSEYSIAVLPRKFTVTWIVDATETVVTVEEGAKINTLDAPTKEGYTFTGWDNEIPETMPAQDLTFTALWTPNAYDAVFDANGGEFVGGDNQKTIPVDFDSTIVFDETPVLQGYRFLGWSADGKDAVETLGYMDSINGKKFTALWTESDKTPYTVETYTMNADGKYVLSTEVVYGTTNADVELTPEISNGFSLNTERSILAGKINADGSLKLTVYIDRNGYKFTVDIDGNATTVTYLYGAKIVKPENPAKTGHTFDCWSVAVPDTMPAEDLTVKAVWKINSYDVIWIIDGKESKESYKYGSAINKVEPSKTGHTFAGWDKQVPDTMPAENLTFTALWSVNNYNVVWIADGVETKETYSYGSKINEPVTPEKTGHTFSGWDNKIPDAMPAENLVFTAQWIVNSYDIIWVVDDVESKQTYKFGETIVAPENPTKEGHEFVGWSKSVPETMPAESLIFTAVWDTLAYDVIWIIDGVETKETYNYGSTINTPAAPVKEGYTFAGWDNEIPATMPANSLTFTAEWDINSYDITWIVDSVETTQNYQFGAEVKALENPSKEGYTFTGWSREIPKTMPAENITITAQWQVNIYTVTWNVDGKTTVNNVAFGSTVVKPSTPVKSGYKFLGWTPDVPGVMPAENLTFTAQFELMINQFKIKNPSVTTINYGETLVLHADYGNVELPEGWTIQWTVEGAGFSMAPSEDGMTCKLTSIANGNATAKATLVDENGEAVLDAEGNEMSDTKELTSKAGFWQKFVSFFKNLFRISRIILQSI